MKSKAAFKIVCKEEGRGRGTTEQFKTLEEASKYIEERWQGAEYMDGKEAFHTDYCTYELVGFTLKDIGTLGFNSEEGYYTFKFHNRQAMLPADPGRNIIVQWDSEGQAFHMLATSAYLEEHQEQFLNGEMDGPYTPAEYLAKFHREFDNSQNGDCICESMLEQHARHGEHPEWYQLYCPHCAEIVKNRPVEKDEVPF